MRHVDTKKALALHHRAKELFNQLGIKDGLMRAANIAGIIHCSRGEYDAGIESFIESIRLRERAGRASLTILPMNIARAYNDIGHGEEALEWATMALERFKSQPVRRSFTHLAMATALINLGRLEEAFEYLEKGKQLMLKSGLETAIIACHYVEGIYDSSQGRLTDAMFNFERALEVSQQIKKQNDVFRSLLQLAECEVSLFNPNSKNDEAEFSGQWMEQLYDEINRIDVPGIRGLALLLQAKLRLKQGRRKEAETLMHEVRLVAQSPGVKFLYEKEEELRTLLGFVDN
jgi:tetratricopeptide (TPR) repeat protein